MKTGDSHSPEIEFEGLYREFLQSSRVPNSVSNYVSYLRGAACLLDRRITPSLFKGGETAKDLLPKELKGSNVVKFRTALRCYKNMVDQNFKGRFQREPGESLGSTRKEPATLVSPLSATGRRLLRAIVQYIGSHEIESGFPETYPNYGLIYRIIEPNAPENVLYIGRQLQKKGLDHLNEWTMRNKQLPKITGLIVDKSKKRPGQGFFDSYGKDPKTDVAWWHEEVRKSLEFDWSRYIVAQQSDSTLLVADDFDEDAVVPRVLGTVSRIVRDTKAAREVKALHGHCCQICGTRLELSQGLFYSEAHHLKPLGKPYNGPDKKSNLVCVCPNCHVKLDYHAIRLTPDKLRTKEGHTVDSRFIEHHNSFCE